MPCSGSIVVTTLYCEAGGPWFKSRESAILFYEPRSPAQLFNIIIVMMSRHLNRIIIVTMMIEEHNMLGISTK